MRSGGAGWRCTARATAVEWISCGRGQVAGWRDRLAVAVGRGGDDAAPRGSPIMQRVSRAALAYYPSRRLPSMEGVSMQGSFMSAFSRLHKVPSWVAERLTVGGVDGPARRGKFWEDSSIPLQWRSRSDDYWDSGWSRGHMAASGSHKQTQELNDETFNLNRNIIPQDLSNNGCDWYRLENLSKRFGQHCKEVFVVSGPLWLPKDTNEAELRGFKCDATQAETKKEKVRVVRHEVLGPRQVTVPTHFFKVIVAIQKPKRELAADAAAAEAEKAAGKEHSWEDRAGFINSLATMGPVGLGAFIQANRPENKHKPLTDFRVPLEAVETLGGLDFTGLSDFCERRLVQADSSFPFLATLKLTLRKRFGGAVSPTPSPVDIAERRTFLKSVDLCGSGSENRCRDEFTKTDSRILSWRYMGQLETSKSPERLESVWTEICKIGQDSDKFLKRSFDKKMTNFREAAAEKEAAKPTSSDSRKTTDSSKAGMAATAPAAVAA